MKVFLSSVIGGVEEFRAAAREAAESLGHTVTAAEDFGASPLSPQQVCLTGVRQADVVVLLLGSRYGAVQSSGLSPTHEEYRAARGSKPVLVFVQEGVTPEPGQDTFIKEVSHWEGVSYRQSFDTPAALRTAVTRALHQWELSQQAGPVDEQELAVRTARLLPKRAPYTAGTPVLHVVVAGAPVQQLLRPGDLDASDLQRDMEREAQYGEQPVFDTRQGVQASVQGTTLAIRQPNAEITLDEDGSVRISRPARNTPPRGRIASGIASLIEEDVRDRVAAAIRYAGWLLDLIDDSHRLTRVGLACRLDGVGYMPWRTREEAAASPNQASMNLAGIESADSPPIVLPRAALLFDVAAKAEDITVRLRRQASR